MCVGELTERYYYHEDDGELVHIGTPHKNTPSIYIEVNTGKSFHLESFKVNYCPRCGTKLTKENEHEIN